MALKVFSSKQKSTDELNREARKESQILDKLSHPNILRYIKTIETEDLIMIASEFVPGKNLEQVLLYKLNSGSFFSESEVANIAQQLLEALSFCHAEGIMHRDVKPDNVILDDDGHVTLIDFGMAEYTNSPARELAGTPYYMEPEMLEQYYMESCDVWSLGILVYYLLTG